MLITVFPFNVFSDDPVWLLLEHGRQFFEKGEYGKASRIFRDILEKDPGNADAEVWLARLFENEGEYDLAERQYLKVLEDKNNLYILDDATAVYYSLAEIYRITDNYGKYEKTLLKILEDEENNQNMNLQYSINDTFKEFGIDKMFELYRYQHNKYNSARRQLGVFFYKTGRYTDAEINLIMPMVSILTTGFNYIYDRTADYDYSDITNHIQAMQEYSELNDFIENNNLFEIMYYLGASYYADGFVNAAEELWRLVYYNTPADSQWHNRASRQLRSPYVEPIITNRS